MRDIENASASIVNWVPFNEQPLRPSEAIRRRWLWRGVVGAAASKELQGASIDTRKVIGQIEPEKSE